MGQNAAETKLMRSIASATRGQAALCNWIY
jgi:hypothetical protein